MLFIVLVVVEVGFNDFNTMWV